MTIIEWSFLAISAAVVGLTALAGAHPYLYDPYYSLLRYSAPPYYGSFAHYADHHVQAYSPHVAAPYARPFHHSALSSYLATPDDLPVLNVLAEEPHALAAQFTVVPMVVVAKDNMRMVGKGGQIMAVSAKKPAMTVKMGDDSVVQCTPAVRITLEQPIAVFSLRSNIVFPREIEIVHDGLRIPIRVGAVIAPVLKHTFVSYETPITISVVYAVPTKPIKMPPPASATPHDELDNQAVVIESEPTLPPANVTIIDFPDKEAEPVLQVDEEDEELVNRNPPIVLAPAGIVQSTQPQTHVEQFTNPKESPVLAILREESKKRI